MPKPDVRDLFPRDHPEDWYRIEAKAGAKTATVYLFDEIGFWGTSAKDFAREVAGLDVEDIQLHVNSPGGEVFDAIAILNTLRAHKAKVTVTVDGLAASAASVIAMGGDEVVMARNSELMIHDPMGLVVGNSADMAEMVQRLDQSADNLASIYAEKAGGEAATWRKAMQAETWYTAQEAVDAGLADRVDAKATADAATTARFNLSIFNHAGRAKAPAPQIPPAEPPAATPTTPEGVGVMPTLNEGLRKLLGVEDTDQLNDDALLAKAAESFKAAATPKDPPPDPPKDDDKPVSMKGLPEGAVVVDRATLDALQKSAKRADAVVEKMNAKERDDALTAAVKDGKLPPASVPHWATAWDKDPEGTRTQLDRMPKNLVPVEQVGYDDGDDGYDNEFAGLYPLEG